jgi:hypothetical protein
MSKKIITPGTGGQAFGTVSTRLIIERDNFGNIRMEIKNMALVPIAPIDVLDILATTQQMNIRYLANQQNMVINPNRVENAESTTEKENHNGSGGDSSGGIVTH